MLRQLPSGIYVDMQGPMPDPDHIPGVTTELEAAAEKLFKERREGGLMVIFAFQPREVRLKYLKLAGWVSPC